nr:chymotrypsin-type serine protease and RNase III domain-containing protein [Fusarium asiaticum vivivirus 1]
MNVDGQVGVANVKSLDSFEKYRGQYGGYVATFIDNYVERVKPRMSLMQAAKVEQAALPPDDATMRKLLRGFPADWANSYFRHNKMVEGSRGLWDVVPRIPTLDDRDITVSDEPGVSDAFAVLDEVHADRLKAKREGKQAKKPKYFLAQLFTDNSVIEKLKFDHASLMLVSRTAVGDPVAACTLAVKLAKKNGMDVTVSVGDYAKGRKASRAAVLQAASEFVVDPYTSINAGDKECIEYRYSNSNLCWSLRGAFWQKVEMDALYRIGVNRGESVLGALFTDHMITLGIEFAPSEVDYGINYQPHYGSEFSEGFPGTGGMDLANDVRAVASSVVPVIWESRVVASALITSNSTCCVNWHVVDKLQKEFAREDTLAAESLHGLFIQVAGQNVRVELERQRAFDVWDARIVDVELGYVADALSAVSLPIFREAEVGEEVVLVYAVKGDVEFSDVCVVDRVEKDSVVCFDKPKQARPGLSGAALVALSDGAILGSYTGANNYWGMASTLCGEKDPFDWAEKHVASLCAPSSFGDYRCAAKVYEDLKARGLEPDMRRIGDSLCPLFSAGERVGVEFRTPYGAATMLDPTAWDVVDSRGDALVFGPCANGGGVRPLASGMQSAVVNCRIPERGETVFVFFKDKDGVGFSELFQIEWMSLDKKRFRLSGVPKFEGLGLEGMVVVALADCSPVGMYVKVSHTQKGMLGECSSWTGMFSGSSSEQLPFRVDLPQKLQSVFRDVNMSGWKHEDVRQIVVAQGDVAAALAAVGNHACGAFISMEFAKDNPLMSPLVSMKFESDEWLAEVYLESAREVCTLSGALASERARTLRIYLGLVYIYEARSVFLSVLKQLGLLEMELYGPVGYCNEHGSRPRSL